MTLSQLAIFLGLGFAVPQFYALSNPAAFRAACRKFPRSEPWGYALVALGTVWFLWNLNQESISDFKEIKPMLLAAFGFIGVATCLWVRDFLAVRGLAVVLLLAAKSVLEIQRWHGSGWKNIIAGWAYVWVIAGIWLTVSPWRLRDYLDWEMASDRRARLFGGLRLAFGLLLALLGLLVF